MSKQPSEKWSKIAYQAIDCHHHAANHCDCAVRRRVLALVIDAAIAAARTEAYEKCIALARNSGYHALVAEIRALAAQEARDGAQ